MKEHKSLFRRILLGCIIAAFCILPAMAENVTVSREIDPSPASVGDEVQVHLSVDGMNTGGIVETIPDGCTFLSTTYPAEKYRVSGNTVLFSVIDSREITYLMQAQKEGTWIFAGTWDDTFNKTDGTIPESRLTVGKGSGMSSQIPAENGTAAPSNTTAGLGTPLQIGILTLALVIAGTWYRRSRS